MRIGIDGLSVPIASGMRREASHNASWPLYWERTLKYLGHDVEILGKDSEDRYDEFDRIAIYNIKNDDSVNLFGGWTPWADRHFRALTSRDPKTVIALDKGLPDIHERVWRYYGQLLGASGWHLRVPVWTIPPSENVVIGDSHALSSMPEHYYWKVMRNDHKTLHGAIEGGLFRQTELLRAKRIVVNFGNIDLRHHVMRWGGWEAACELIFKLERALVDLQDNGCTARIELVEAFPMTDDSRRISKLSYFRGEPFYGPLDERKKSVAYFNGTMWGVAEKHGWDVFQQPTEFYNSAGLFDESYMEKPGNVHSAPMAYRWRYRVEG